MLTCAELQCTRFKVEQNLSRKGEWHAIPALNGFILRYSGGFTAVLTSSFSDCSFDLIISLYSI